MLPLHIELQRSLEFKAYLIVRIWYTTYTPMRTGERHCDLSKGRFTLVAFFLPPSCREPYMASAFSNVTRHAFFKWCGKAEKFQLFRIMPHKNNRKGHCIRKTYWMSNKLTEEDRSISKGNYRTSMPQEGRIMKHGSIERLPGIFLSNDKDYSKHSDKILREGDCVHSFVDMPIMLYLNPSLTSLVSFRIANDFLSKANK